MKKFSSLIFLFIQMTFTGNSFAGIEIDNYNVTAWKRDQLITGTIDFPSAGSGILYVNNKTYPLLTTENQFFVPVILDEGVNTIYAKADSLGAELTSDTIRITLGYKLKPEVYAYAEVSGTNVDLHVQVIDNPDSARLSFTWSQGLNNPSPVSLTGSDSSVSFVLPQGSPLGEYYFDLFAIEQGGDTSKARTFVTVSKDSIHAFNIRDDYAGWIDSAIIYEITPFKFVSFGKFNDITLKIPELKELGITTIWLQPIYHTVEEDQGYHVTDYFRIRGDLGSEADLRNLINTAKEYGLKVLFDFVPNHTSLRHPYALDSRKGPSSYYYNFYQRQIDFVPYSQHYKDSTGSTIDYDTTYRGLINYFWNELPNLNYNNPEVQKWMTEAAKYWIEKFDIDGYRFDAVWGVTARNPEFTKQLRLSLKRIKPEILMLAEDKASQPQVFDERFDAAYNWAPGTDWVSEWVWQTDYDPERNPTIFNSSVGNPRDALRRSLTNTGAGYAPDAKILRFLENNDLFHFITHHNLDQTKMAAALVYALDGVPLLYNGQEIGKKGHPYDPGSIFNKNKTIQSLDQVGLFPYYQKLNQIRRTYSALISDNFSELPVTATNAVYGFRRYNDEQNIFTLINMKSAAVDVSFNLPMAELKLDSSKIYYITDLISGSSQSGFPADLSTLSIRMNGYSTQILLLADSIPTVVSVSENVSDVIPSEFELLQNYPNPFNPVTNFTFRISETGEVSLKIFDILGKEVIVLLNEVKAPGEYDIQFNAADFASGIYFAKLQSGTSQIIKKIVLLK